MITARLSKLLDLFLVSSSSSSFLRTASIIGVIIAVVAVFVIHIEIKAVTIMNPNINLWKKRSCFECDLAINAMIEKLFTNPSFFSISFYLSIESGLFIGQFERHNRKDFIEIKLIL